MITIIGGSGSGKSEYAENLAVWLHRKEAKGKLLYIATMKPFGEEAQKRIMRHHKLRLAKGFETIECYRDMGTLESNMETLDTVLLECMQTLTANEMFDTSKKYLSAEELLFKIKTDIEKLEKSCKHLIIVTGDIFSDGIIYEEQTEAYRRVLASCNAFLAENSERVIEVVYGCPVVLMDKGGYKK